MTKPNVHFEKLEKDEKQSKLYQASQKKLDVTIWLKGSNSREKLKSIEFNKDTLQYDVIAGSDDSLIDKSVLYSFVLNGVNYFGKADLKRRDQKIFSLKCADDLFKSERRETFRLLTYPAYQVYAFFKIDEEYHGQNIVDFKTKQSQTGIFKDFLKIVGETEDSLEKKGYLHFRIMDISVTGLSFEIGDLERKFFEENKKLGQMFISFEGEEIAIPNAMPVYIIDAIGAKTKSRVYKVGLKFLEVDLALDQKLGKILYKALRDVEDEFEDFIK